MHGSVGASLDAVVVPIGTMALCYKDNVNIFIALACAVVEYKTTRHHRRAIRDFVNQSRVEGSWQHLNNEEVFLALFET